MKNKTIVIILNFICLFAIPAYSQLTGNILKIRGDATFNATPEIMVINVPVESKDSVYENCSEKLIARYNKLKHSLVSNGIKEELIKTDRFNIRESYSWIQQENKRERVFDGYSGFLNVLIELEYSPSVLNTIIQTLNDDSLNFPYNLSFKLSEDQKKNLLQDAITTAINDARDKADIIAQSLDIKLVRIAEINYGYLQASHDILTTQESQVFYMTDDDTSTELNLNPQEIPINKSIAIFWEIE